MKKYHFLLLIILMLCGSKVRAQADFAPVLATWYYNYIKDGYEGYKILHAAKDTILDGQLCRKIEGILITQNEWSGTIDSSALQPFFVYSNPDTVFYYNDHFERFLPLYIFNVAAGDTIQYHMPDAAGDTVFNVVVIDITTDTIEGNVLRKIHVDPVDGIGFIDSRTYTERLGFGAGGLDMYLYAHTNDVLSLDLRCYSDDFIHYRQQPGIDCDACGQSNNIGQPDNDPELSVYPSPATERIEIKNRNRQDYIRDIKLYDATGRIVFDASGNLNNSVSIPATGFTRGTYILRVNMKRGNVVKKINIL